MTFKSDPRDFVVREQLAFIPSGAGEHCYALLEKTNLTTPELARLLADAHALEPVDVGYAGMKDKRAVTSQWFSLRGVDRLDDTVRELPGVRVLEETRHPQKLRKGQLSGNHFVVRLLGLDDSRIDAVLGALRGLAESGAPNYYGSQRFGWDNVEQATHWLARRRRVRVSKFRQGLYLSVLRSFLFNEVLGARVRDGSWRMVLDGDVLLDGLPTGPLWGRGRSAVSDAAGAVESAALAAHAAILEGLEFAGLKQDRRSFVLRADQLRWSQPDDSSVTVEFSLPRGGYATSLLGDRFELNSPEPVSPPVDAELTGQASGR